jgi:hypothetical protein
MKGRRVYSTPSIEVARHAMAAARSAGVADDDISLVARADIELEAIPDGRKEADTDFMPAALRGAGIGGATGLLAGLAAVAIPPFGVTVAGALALTVIGAAVGTWASALVGATIEEPLRRKFEQEIAAGRILLVIDADEDCLQRAESLITAAGGSRLPYAAVSAVG